MFGGGIIGSWYRREGDLRKAGAGWPNTRPVVLGTLLRQLSGGRRVDTPLLEYHGTGAPRCRTALALRNFRGPTAGHGWREHLTNKPLELVFFLKRPSCVLKTKPWAEAPRPAHPQPTARITHMYDHGPRARPTRVAISCARVAPSSPCGRQPAPHPWSGAGARPWAPAAAAAERASPRPPLRSARAAPATCCACGSG